ncbi:hypothetical protein CEXT_21321 [Caerostris extrusa]|uniref:Secreted protein n=1 Tax=Caerostris extrusa TaxID=172846 RepID=A0AAV4QBL1_CAEEX|nr:hypothetical protein CEXT_21321 [Caerostris extrusa]
MFLLPCLADQPSVAILACCLLEAVFLTQSTAFQYGNLPDCHCRGGLCPAAALKYTSAGNTSSSLGYRAMAELGDGGFWTEQI